MTRSLLPPDLLKGRGKERDMRICKLEKCSKKYWAKGFCQKHYDKFIHSPKRKVNDAKRIRAYRRTSKARFSFGRARANYKKQNWELTFEEYCKLIEKNICRYCKGNLDETGVSLDRIDSTKGYTKNNSIPCCGICNYMKRTLSLKEFFVHIEKIHKNIRTSFKEII